MGIEHHDLNEINNLPTAVNESIIFADQKHVITNVLRHRITVLENAAECCEIIRAATLNSSFLT